MFNITLCYETLVYLEINWVWCKKNWKMKKKNWNKKTWLVISWDFYVEVKTDIAQLFQV